MGTLCTWKEAADGWPNGDHCSITIGHDYLLHMSHHLSAGTLKEVELAGCRARGDEAAVAVIKAATKNNSLHLLDLRGVPLGPEVGWVGVWSGGSD